MMSAKPKLQTRVRALADNPLEGEQLLLDSMFGRVAPRRPRPVRKDPTPKPQHYKIVSISLYTEDIDRLEGIVQELKRRGHTKANKSQVIRRALALLDLDSIGNGR